MSEVGIADGDCLSFKEDRYGGVEVSAVATAAAGADGTARFASELRARVAGWEQAGKQGLWLTIPIAAAACIGPAVELGFEFHHAKPGYALLTRWLPSTPSPLPVYGFTQIGVGGVVVNAAGTLTLPYPDCHRRHALHHHHERCGQRGCRGQP